MGFNALRKLFIATSNMKSKFLKIKMRDMGRLCAFELYYDNVIGRVLSYSIQWNKEEIGRVGDR